MQNSARWSFIVFALLLPLTVAAEKKAPKESEDMEHVREELGVNEFTAPSIDLVLEELGTIGSIPFDKVWRDLPDSTPQSRSQLALSAGAVIADGFLAVTAQKQSRIESVGRVLLRLAKGLGVGDHVTKHSRSILEKAAKSNWDGVKKELVRAQADVESGLLGLKDEEIAHLVALGGWLRGLEMTSTVAVEEYTPEKARRLIQPELLDYFLDRVETLNPTFKSTKIAQTIETNLKEIKVITTKPVDAPIEREEATKVRDLVREINKQIANGE